jgi:hypothetical protein
LVGSTRALAAVAAAIVAAGLAACGGDEDVAVEETTSRAAATTQVASAADLGGVKDYLLDHTDRLTRFTSEFKADAQAYHDLAESSGFDYQELWNDHAGRLAPLLEGMKNDWVEGNPYYERMEGVVAGTPSLAEYDVILDAGSSAAEDPESAVPFDLELSDGTTFKQPGNLYNLTEGAL